MTTAPTKTTRLPDSCALCGDGTAHDHRVLHLRARCHSNAPLRLTYEKTGAVHKTVEIGCYVPKCGRAVAAFRVSAVIHPERNAAVPTNTCDLCGDNDARLLHGDATHLFTAPFRVESHKDDDGHVRLHVHCYSKECDQLFAVIALDDERLS